MKRLYKLENPVKHYDWGSPVWIPRFLGRENPGNTPWAEVWMGAHPGGASKTAEDGLDSLIQRDPPHFLGAGVFREFGGLPFLFKLLAAEKPLSIQAHPNREQARAGWDRENRAGIPLDAANRNYKDPNHKPEILCALAPFRALCGFREIPEIQRLLDCFCRELESGAWQQEAGLRKKLGELRSALEGAQPEKSLEALLRSLFTLKGDVRRVLGVYTREALEPLERAFPEYAAEWRTAAYFASLYPEDPGMIAPLYLNLLNLAPGEAIYLPAGVLHAYIEGFGVELMANSDNVLRGGLTEKHVDMDELAGILRFVPGKPVRTKAPEGAGFFTYPSGCGEFSLSVAKSAGGSQIMTGPGPRLLLVTAGSAALSVDGGGETLTLTQGESAFAAPVEELTVAGACTLYVAGIGR